MIDRSRVAAGASRSRSRRVPRSRAMSSYTTMSPANSRPRLSERTIPRSPLRFMNVWLGRAAPLPARPTSSVRQRTRRSTGRGARQQLVDDHYRRCAGPPVSFARLPTPRPRAWAGPRRLFLSFFSALGLLGLSGFSWEPLRLRATACPSDDLGLDTPWRRPPRPARPLPLLASATTWTTTTSVG